MSVLTEKTGFAMDGVAQVPVILRGDCSGRIVSCGQNLPDVGLRREEVFGKHWRSLFPGFQKIPITSASGAEQFLLVRDSPDERAYRVVVHQIAGADGAPDGVFVAVEAHTVECTPALREFEKNQCLGRVAGELAHELNNTLTSISGWLQIISQDLAPGDPRRKSLEVVYGEAQRTARMAASLLAMARGEGGAPHTLLNLNGLLDAVLALVEPSLRENCIEVKTEFGELPHVSGSEDELKQVFLNLLLNAAGAIGKEGRIRVRTETSSCGLVRAGVSDSGCGIQPDDLDRIFKAFYTTRSEQGGTGLGLFVSRRIIKQHNGDLLVESAPGEGSTFTVVLPRAGRAGTT